MKLVLSNFSNSVVRKTLQFIVLLKFRLSMLVIFSSVIGYLFGSKLSFDLYKLFFLALGGSLVTFSSNAINQYIEKETDKLMLRTQNRPLPTNKLGGMEVILFIGITAFSGLSILAIVFNPTTALLSALSLLLYGFFYTPLKKITSFAVFVGAIPGALPPLLGYVAATNALDQNAIWLFLVQFFWQFPHFWAIAWVSFEDYKRAGIMLLPSKDGKSKTSTIIILMYTLMLIPLTIYPFIQKNIGIIGSCIILASSIVFSFQAYRLFRNAVDSEAKKLMFYSFGYLLIFLISLFL
jgi:protoheme IX farnesyltransferase